MCRLLALASLAHAVAAARVGAERGLAGATVSVIESGPWRCGPRALGEPISCRSSTRDAPVALGTIAVVAAAFAVLDPPPEQ